MGKPWCIGCGKEFKDYPKLARHRTKCRKYQRQHYYRHVLVSYCPGDSVGSPATIELQKAEKFLREDISYLAAIREVGFPVKYLPHIGGVCERCR